MDTVQLSCIFLDFMVLINFWRSSENVSKGTLQCLKCKLTPPYPSRNPQCTNLQSLEVVFHIFLFVHPANCICSGSIITSQEAVKGEPLRDPHIGSIQDMTLMGMRLILLRLLERFEKLILHFSGLCKEWDENHLELSSLPKGLIRTVAFVIATSLDM